MAVSRGAEGEDGHPGILHRAGQAHQRVHQASRREGSEAREAPGSHRHGMQRQESGRDQQAGAQVCSEEGTGGSRAESRMGRHTS
eukprot:8049201-Pyramimonas_sp.AAC.1